ncbi:MAG: PilZ domain-containing protein [Hyphomonadaceae bacterium]|nr:PilZ domain-containing protein [Hyphomonadaceae bacterium]
MFGKSKPPPKSALADRMRRVTTHRPPAGADEWELLPPPPPHASKLHARSERAPAYRQGVIVIEDGQRVTVVIKNLSASGARIEFFLKRELPAVITLIEVTKRIHRRARVVWQGDGVAGIEFLPD